MAADAHPARSQNAALCVVLASLDRREPLRLPGLSLLRGLRPPRRDREALHADLRDGEAMTDWYSVSNVLPSFGGDYLVYADGEMFVAEFFTITKSWGGYDELTVYPEFWCALPEPPK
jgi:hypothetical protein